MLKIVFFMTACIFTWNAQAMAGEIIVSAAASLANAMDEIRENFIKKHPDIVILTNYAASNPLLQQMKEGAPVDVFASADQPTMDKAAAAGLIKPESRRNFAANALVLIIPKNSNTLQSQDDLPKMKRVAVGNPDSVPAGRYAREALQSASMWDALTPALVFGESVRQVLDYVAREEVDAGVVYATDAALLADKVRVAVVLQGHSPIIYPVAVAMSSPHPQEAQLFVDFLSSSEGQKILQQFGFIHAIP